LQDYAAISLATKCFAMPEWWGARQLPEEE